MDANFKQNMEGLLKGLQGLQENAINSVKKSFENCSKEDLKQFEDALKSSKVEEIVRQNMKIILDLNKSNTL